MASVSKIAVGTANFGTTYGLTRGFVSPLERERIFAICQDNNIDTLDTSQLYEGSETALGSSAPFGMKVVSKFSVEGFDHVVEQRLAQQIFDKTINNLGAETLYGLLFHRPEELATTVGKRCLADLLTLREAGMIRKVGVSIYSPAELDQILEVFVPDLIQFPFNVFDQRMMRFHGLNELRSRGVEFHARSAFLQGLVLANVCDIDSRFKEWHQHFRRFEILASKTRRSKLNLAIECILQNDWIDKVVLGLNGSNQLQEVIDCWPTGRLSVDFTGFSLGDERLLHPSKWSQL